MGAPPIHGEEEEEEGKIRAILSESNFNYFTWERKKKWIK